MANNLKTIKNFSKHIHCFYIYSFINELFCEFMFFCKNIDFQKSSKQALLTSLKNDLNKDSQKSFAETSPHFYILKTRKRFKKE